MMARFIWIYVILWMLRCRDVHMSTTAAPTEINECASQPCMNGGTCSEPLPDYYFCSCVGGFDGQNCGQDINECASNPCVNGDCNDKTNMYNCTCQPGWTGVDCSIDFDECSSHPCLNGATCTDELNRFTCTCDGGFTGERCLENIDIECMSDPCVNGLCINERNLYFCICDPGWTSIDCGTEINECSSDPCLSGGTCNDEVNAFTCDCPAGLLGQRCQDDENGCGSNSCTNGYCLDEQNMYSCSCFLGWTGVNCQIDIDDCSPEACKNGGTCVDHLNAFSCKCPGGFRGAICEKDDPCAPNPCMNNCSCSLVDDTTAVCTSDSTFITGTFCERVHICIRNDVCKNGGTCVMSDIDSFRCNCPMDTTGNLCQTAMCSSDICNGNGICDVVNGESTCLCSSDWVGTFCNIDNPCAPNPCLNECSCSVTDVFTPQCTSSTPLITGPLCENVHSCLSSNPCGNGGTCNAVSPQLYTCLCLEGFTGNECQNAIGCLGSVCSNGGTCQYNQLTGLFASCLCTSEYYGFECENAYPCTLQQCFGRGTCTNDLATIPLDYTCTCFTSYIGRSCEYDNPCFQTQNPCQNGGSCSYTDGWTNPPIVDCTCPIEYTGDRCENLLHPCEKPTQPCLNGATCIPTIDQLYTCDCPSGFIGRVCEFTDPCVTLVNLCYNGATCASTFTGTTPTFSCNCTEGWSGPRCNGVGCTDMTCLNGGTCESDDSTGAFTACSCSPGYYGEYCENAYPCTSNPCQGRGSCNNNLQGIPYNFTCNCVSPYIGETCQYDDPCLISNNTCLNGGTCDYIGGSSSPPVKACLCQDGFYGDICENATPTTSVTMSMTSHDQNTNESYTVTSSKSTEKSSATPTDQISSTGDGIHTSQHPIPDVSTQTATEGTRMDLTTSAPAGQPDLLTIAIIVSSVLVVIIIIGSSIAISYCCVRRRRSNIALKQLVSDREGQELNLYTSLDATTMKQLISLQGHQSN